jgi:hypothetical protein|tara:strand:+ start:125 stop:376 length:252 start_codon:yes stop_codon:yes gene_type:complete
MNKKGQGISINVIIIAVIALLVLVILSALLVRYMGDLVTECVDVNGQCESGSCADLDGFYTTYKSARCPNEEDTCCVAISKND